uniref:C3/C5 convertase n=1 Tax=Scleropages formosus TaxID=113540 RepID=A0A8C9V7P8_SCLFO
QQNLSIVGGNYTLSDGTNPNSLLTYSCLEGYYPFPTQMRQCQRSGRWYPPLKKSKPAECLMVTCPDPLVFEYGSVSPIQMMYYVNNETTYKCFDGYKFVGSKTRVCQLNGKWSGNTPICDQSSAVCPDPGIPAGSRRTGRHFDIDDKVAYRCDNGLILIGSAERVCQESGEWTGIEPACYYKHTYDTPQEVAKAFSKAISSDLDLAVLDESSKIRLEQGGNLHIYIAIDKSDSVEEENFINSKNAMKKLIEKISFFEVTPKYELLFFATKVKEVVKITDPGNENVDIIQELDNYKYSGPEDNSGTNIAQAFHTILERMSIVKERQKATFKDVRHVIILFSDGIANMGGSADDNVAKIKYLVESVRGKDWEDYLDIYTFGVGPEINEDALNSIASKKPDERHFYKLKDIKSLEQTFDEMIGKLYGIYLFFLCQREGKESTCIGSLVNTRFVLTAAHCFTLDDTEKLHRIIVEIHNPPAYKVKSVRPHKNYNNQAKKDLGIPEFYDYDVALIELEKDVTFSANIRPICIPCTKEASHALGLPDTATCKDQGEVHISCIYIIAYEEDDTGPLFCRDNCIEDALETIKIEDRGKVKAKDIVTDNFLCTGGIDGPQGQTDDISCKGESGGALFVQKKRRLIQVGIISWGVKNLCQVDNPKSDEKSRDFHINLFRVTDFLKERLGKTGETYAPLTFIK